MLKITRRCSESVVIGEREVTLTILGIGGQCVRIGIEAPKEVAVYRKEIYDRITLVAPLPTNR
ncbi:hypothetical protein D3C84_804120 [compost metagenome]|jgi:carbon storage regulator|uniref:Translational regulator CsrA n=1 Tax=Pseudomonas laurylsulfatiphila TaxID=2011015 RepID=A0A2S6FH47_9PSED|nr:carbon storage regulator CsrA [Pseudomonas laurylsulfatiphila]PPK36736.1 carbon storage regulator [Pseudomonas laurylsulfatiphila]